LGACDFNLWDCGLTGILFFNFTSLQYFNIFSAAEILYENFYTAQNNQKTGLPSQQWTNHPMARASLPPTPGTTPQTNGKLY
jgi:hypothetical protein